MTLSKVCRTLFIASLLTFSGQLQAQVIRGTVEDSTRMPLNDVLVTLLPATGDSVLRSARTGNAGEFSIGIPRTGRYRVRLNRIGYSQQTSAVLEVKQAEVVTLKFTMLVAAQVLSRVEVVERRPITMNELMSASGFDMRQNRFPMNSMNLEELEAEGEVSLETLFMMRTFAAVEIVEDTLGASLRMTSMDTRALVRGFCIPEVHLDGILLSDGQPSTAAAALTIFASISARQAYGIEVYRGREIPPPGLGGLLGSNGDIIRPCGVVAVWTKVGRERFLIVERARAEGSVQVVRGKAVDFSTGEGIPGVVLTLQSESGANLEAPVTTDSSGAFAIRTKHFERLRLSAFGGRHVSLATPAFSIDLEELLTVEVIMATDRTPPAAIALVSRELARNYTATDIRGFAFRARRGLHGTFFDSTAVSRSGANTLSELIGRVPHVLTGTLAEAAAGVTPPQGGVLFTRMVPELTAAEPRRSSPRRNQTPSELPQASPPCAPMYFLNGELQRDPTAQIRGIPLAALYGVEVYTQADEVPYVYRMGSTGCGIIGVWQR